jgi:hypothetical protein
VTSVTKGETQRLSKPIDMTIHWKALEEHFLRIPLVFGFKFGGNTHFLNFSKKRLDILLSGHENMTKMF